VTAASVDGARLRAVIFDLDDTLVPQVAWLEGAWWAVVSAATLLDPGVDPQALHSALVAEASGGSARGQIIDRAVAAVGCVAPIPPLVKAFQDHRAPRFDAYPGALAVLRLLHRAVPLAVITDGNPPAQRAKLEASTVARWLDAVVCSDELGREHRKPDPVPFLRAIELLGAEPGETAFVGDRPTTDLVGAATVGLRTVRVRTGEYADDPNVVYPDADLPDIRAVGRWLWARVEGNRLAHQAEGAGQ
jgi:putative hydrolase of the HAD superfamily